MREWYVTEKSFERQALTLHRLGIWLGMRMPSVDAYPSFWSYVRACRPGAWFKYAEVVAPHRKQKAKRAGHTTLVPPRHLWMWATLVIRLANLIRKEIGTPVKMRNLYRPMSYNAMVATSGIKSDHPNACGADLDFKTIGDRRKAEGFLRGLMFARPDFNISMGIGSRTLHVGIHTPRGSRIWAYKSREKLRNEPLSKRWQR